MYDAEYVRSLDDFSALSPFVPAPEAGEVVWERDYPNPPASEYDVSTATIDLHPLLDAGMRARWDASRSTDLEVGAVLCEYSPAAGSKEESIHLVRRGLFNLVAKKNGETWTASLLRPGQWIGLPLLLRRWHERRGKKLPPWPADLTLEARAMKNGYDRVPGSDEPPAPRIESMSVAAALDLMESYPPFRRFVEHTVAARYVRRREIRALLQRNPLLRQLTSAERQVLLQVGALKRVGELGDRMVLSTSAKTAAGMPFADPETREPYLPAGRASGKIALILKGEAKVYLPAQDGGALRFVAALGPGSLVGHETLASTSAADGQEPAEPPRPTAVWLSEGSEVLEFHWHVFRWLFEERNLLWRELSFMLGAPGSTAPAPLPELVMVYGTGSDPGVATTLAHGLAATLAQEAKSLVLLIDADGERTLSRFTRDRPTTEVTPLSLIGAARRERGLLGDEGPEEADLTVHQLSAPSGGGDFFLDAGEGRVAAYFPEPCTALQIEQTVDAAAETRARYVIVCAALASDQQKRALADRLSARARTTFVVTDDPGSSFVTDAAPRSLTWVYWMTPSYLARAAARSSEAMRQHEAARSRTGLYVVRIPHDVAGVKKVWERATGDLLAPGAERAYPLARAFRRLGRVVRRRTVGLALGGGGAWGFAHLALIKHMESAGIPIDCISGTSFGAIAGGVYAGAGAKGLDLLLDAKVGALLAAASMAGSFWLPSVAWFVDGLIRTARESVGSAAPLLATTEIPFYPVSTDLEGKEPFCDLDIPIGEGVRMSGAMPPVFPSVRWGAKRLVDGMYLANVPSRALRDRGAHFVIASNVVPPGPQQMPRQRILARLVDKAVRTVMGRPIDAALGMFLLASAAGADQAEIAADVLVDLVPTSVQFYELWRGRDLLNQLGGELRMRPIHGDRTASVLRVDDPESGLRKLWERFRPEGR